MKATTRVLSLIAVLALAPAARAQVEGKNPPRPTPAPPTAPTSGPQLRPNSSGQVQMGELAPNFELDGSRGKPVKLSSYRGHWLLLTFGDRKEHFAPLQQVSAELDSSDIRLLGVCGEKGYNLVAYAKRENLSFVVLADLTREISELYGLYDWQERKVLPGYLLISPEGEVRLALLGQSFPPADVARLARYVTGRL